MRSLLRLVSVVFVAVGCAACVTGNIPGGQATLSTCRPLTAPKVYSLLASLTRDAPEHRARMAEGAAAVILAEQAAFVAEGWPSAYFNGWPSQAWLGIDLQAEGKQLIAELEHGETGIRSITQFRFTCREQGQWALTDVGTEQRWYVPYESELDNQRGDLTESLAIALVQDVLEYYGAPRMRISASGPELERGRQASIAQATGGSIKSTWPEKGHRLILRAESPDRVVGSWLNDKSDPTGENVLFAKVEGLWKITDHTEGGNWARDIESTPIQTIPNLDPGLLGLRLGLRQADVIALIGKPDKETDAVHSYSGRDFDVSYTKENQLVRIVVRSGSTAPGLTVGDTVKSVVELYGKPQKRSGNSIEYTDGTQRFRVLFSTGVDGQERVVAMILDRVL